MQQKQQKNVLILHLDAKMRVRLLEDKLDYRYYFGHQHHHHHFK